MITAADLGATVPDEIGEVIAWRAWELVGTPQTPRLASVTALSSWSRKGEGHEAIWPTRRFFLARCTGRQHLTGIPVDDCSCGLYAAKTMDQLIQLGYGAYGGRGNGVDALVDKVVGQVALSGKVIECDQGWRAERGRVYRLWTPYEMDAAVADRLAEAYRVPVEPAQWRDGGFRTLDDLAERFMPKEVIEDGDR